MPDSEHGASPPDSRAGGADVSLQELARRVEELQRSLQEDRQARLDIAARLERQQAQVLDLSRAVRSILTSRIWRTLQSAGGGILAAEAAVSHRLRTWRDTLKPSGKPSRGAVPIDSSPFLSVLMPVYNTPERWLRLAIESVLRQSYTNWELCIADDCSTLPHVRPTLAEYLQKDARIRVIFRERNGHIAAASNSCLELAHGEFFALLDHDDELAPDALREVAGAVAANPAANLIYTDEDKIDEQGFQFDPFFKPDWSPEYLLGCMYTGHLSAYRANLVREVGGFRSEVDGAQDYDLALRVTARTREIVHIPQVLYHWRTIDASMATGASAKAYAYPAAESALRHFLALEGISGQVGQGPACGAYRVQFEVHGDPSVDALIPVSGEPLDLVRKTVESIAANTKTSKLRILLIGTDCIYPPLALAAKGVRLEALPSAAVVNPGSGLAAEYLVLLRPGTEVISADWIERLVEFCQLPGVGAVGPRVLDLNGKIQSAGILFIGEQLWHAYSGQAPDHQGYFLSAQLPRNYLAVSGACLMTRASVFRDLGGLDQGLPPELSAIEYCLRLRERQLRTVFTPFAEVRRASEPAPNPGAAFRSRWSEFVRLDPYYNPNLPTRFPYFPPSV
jgi:O-antigen biosynthesis protein